MFLIYPWFTIEVSDWQTVCLLFTEPAAVTETYLRTPFSLISDTFYSKKKEMQWLFPYLPDLRDMHFERCNVQTICGNHHAESNLATHRSSLISQERGKRGQAQWFMAVMMHPGPEWLISAGNTFRSTSLTSEHPLPKHTTHTYSLAHVCGHFLGVRGERSYLLPGHILYVMTFCWCASVRVCVCVCVDTTCRVLFYSLPPLKYLWLTHTSVIVGVKQCFSIDYRC